MRYEDIERVEKKFYRWVFSKRYKVAMLIVISLFITVISSLPYLNLFFTKEMVFLMSLALGVIIFNVGFKFLFKIVVMLLIAAFLSLLIGKLNIANFIGDSIYVLLGVGVLRGIV